MTRRIGQHVVILLEGFLVLVLISATIAGAYFYLTSYSTIPIWAYPVAVAIAIISYGVGLAFEEII